MTLTRNALRLLATAMLFAGISARGQDSAEMSEAEKKLQFLKAHAEKQSLTPRASAPARPKPGVAKPVSTLKPTIASTAAALTPRPAPEATSAPSTKPKFRTAAPASVRPRPEPTPPPPITARATPLATPPSSLPSPIKRSASNTRLASLAPPSPRLRVPDTQRILMIGDSMAVGEFGEVLQDYLVDHFGRNNVALYASCGSSPEHWVRSGPDFITKCGYREQSPGRTLVCDFENGRAPRPVATPRLEDVVPRLRPTTVIVQLGTNWMDAIEERSNRNNARYDAILNTFISVLRNQATPINRIIWITPPDASRYSADVKQTVDTVLGNAAKRLDFELIDSRQLTHYVRGRTGGDGVHYNGRDAREWATKVTLELDRKLRRNL